LSGASPETDADFEFLAKEGVKTIVSVDGSVPDVGAAAKHGLRYFHLPIGYDGIPRDKQVWLVKAFRDLPGPFYVHCHHGKHRGPAACMVGRMALDGIGAEQAVAEMKARGTDPKYRGLYAVPRTFVAPTEEELAAAPSEFPWQVALQGLQASMVDIDYGWTRLRAVRQAKWGVPTDHPDVDPSHEARILAEHLRELARTSDTKARPESYRKSLEDAEEAAWELSKALEAKPVVDAKATAAFERVNKSCNACHATYRDNVTR
jgi:protein tyrosine phosphatase (PTP) superfamily phosphohydrolase (DUF442 family)